HFAFGGGSCAAALAASRSIAANKQANDSIALISFFDQRGKRVISLLIGIPTANSLTRQHWEKPNQPHSLISRQRSRIDIRRADLEPDLSRSWRINSVLSGISPYFAKRLSRSSLISRTTS